MNKKSKLVNDRRKRIKNILIKELGGECCCCGYDRYQGALEFHHIDPEDKEFSFGVMVSKSLSAISKEIQKCILVCSNCHKEIHDGCLEIPINTPRLTDDFVLKGWKKYIKIGYNKCPVCKKIKLKNRKYCSTKCFGISNRKIDRPNKEELEILIKEQSFVNIGKIYGVSDNAVRKWAKNYNLEYRRYKFK